MSTKLPVLNCVHLGILKRLKNVMIELLTKMCNLSLKSDFQLQQQKEQMYYLNLQREIEKPQHNKLAYQENSFKGKLNIAF